MTGFATRMSCSLFLTFRSLLLCFGSRVLISFWNILFVLILYFLCLCLFAVVAGEHQVEPAARGLHLLRHSGETNRSIGRGGRFVISYIPHTLVKYIPFKCPRSQKAAIWSYSLTLWAGGSLFILPPQIVTGWLPFNPTPLHCEQGAAV